MNTFRHSLFRHTWGCVGVARDGVPKHCIWGGVKCVKNVPKMRYFRPPRGALIIRQIGRFCTPPG